MNVCQYQHFCFIVMGKLNFFLIKHPYKLHMFLFTRLNFFEKFKNTFLSKFWTHVSVWTFSKIYCSHSFVKITFFFLFKHSYNLHIFGSISQICSNNFGKSFIQDFKQTCRWQVFQMIFSLSTPCYFYTKSDFLLSKNVFKWHVFSSLSQIFSKCFR